MCGIAGKVYLEPQRRVEPDALAAMCQALVHRGPDDYGVHLDGNIGLAMRRLAVIDVDTGRQPIHNEDRSVWTVYNGEIYNFAELQRELEARGHRFYTRTDTEVIVHLYEEQGLDFVRSLNGMFTIALWDAARRRLGAAPGPPHGRRATAAGLGRSPRRLPERRARLEHGRRADAAGPLRRRQDVLDRLRRSVVRRARGCPAHRPAIRDGSHRADRHARRRRPRPEAREPLRRAIRRRLRDPDLLSLAAHPTPRDGRPRRGRGRRALRGLRHPPGRPARAAVRAAAGGAPPRAPSRRGAA